MSSWANMLKKSLWGESQPVNPQNGTGSTKTVQSLKENWILVKDDDENYSNIEESVDLNDFSEKDQILKDCAVENLSEAETAKKVQEMRTAWLKKRTRGQKSKGLNNSQYSNVSKKSVNHSNRKRNSPSTCSSNGNEDRNTMQTTNDKIRRSSPDLSDSNEVANSAQKLNKFNQKSSDGNNASNYKMRASNKKTAKNRNKPYGKKPTSLQQPTHRGLN